MYSGVDLAGHENQGLGGQVPRNLPHGCDVLDGGVFGSRPVNQMTGMKEQKVRGFIVAVNDLDLHHSPGVGEPEFHQTSLKVLRILAREDWLAVRLAVHARELGFQLCHSLPPAKKVLVQFRATKKRRFNASFLLPKIPYIVPASAGLGHQGRAKPRIK
jgi:hypothetical protein